MKFALSAAMIFACCLVLNAFALAKPFDPLQALLEANNARMRLDFRAASKYDGGALANIAAARDSITREYLSQRAPLMLGLDYARLDNFEGSARAWCQIDIYSEGLTLLSLPLPTARLTRNEREARSRIAFERLGSMFRLGIVRFSGQDYDGGDDRTIADSIASGSSGDYVRSLAIIRRAHDKGWSNLVAGLANDGIGNFVEARRRYLQSVETIEIASSPIAVPDYSQLAAALTLDRPIPKNIKCAAPP